MEKVIICAGGPDPAIQAIERQTHTIIIGVDRGCHTLIEAGYQLDHAFGDFDSVSAEEFLKIKNHTKDLHQFQSEKDDTDFQLALLFVRDYYPHVTTIEVYGALGGGGRIDHLLANIWLALEPRFETMITSLHFIEAKHQMRLFLPGEHLLNPVANTKYLSLISLTGVKDWRIVGAKYPLQATDFSGPTALISNEFLPSKTPVTLSFSTGVMSCWWVADDHIQ